MTARQYADLVGFEVVGKLTRVGKGRSWNLHYWVDEEGNEYVRDPFFSESGWFIVTKDGGII